MTMAWTAQTGPGPRTVALSLKVFIVVIFYAHERLGLCTAQQLMLPQPLRVYIEDMRVHFCINEGVLPCYTHSGNCGNHQNTLCEQICETSCPFKCWNTLPDIIPFCNGNQNQLCGYYDADVCRDERGVCVYHSYPPSTFCVCSNDVISYTGCEPSAPTDLSSRIPIEGDTPGTTTHVTTTDQLINYGINVAAIVLGSLFALLLLLVIIGAVIFCLRRQERLASSMKQTANPAELSSVPLEAMNATESRLPAPPVPGSSMENSYAYDHRPAKPGVKEVSDQDDHTYYSVGEGGSRQGNPRYVSGGQRKTPATKEPDTATDDGARNENGGGHADMVGLTGSTTGVKSIEANDEDYTPLVPSGIPKSRSEQPGKEVVVSPTLANESEVTSPVELPTEGLSNGDDGTYFPLIQAAAPKSHVDQSGYEVAKIPTSKSHDSTSPTGVQSISCDDNTYTPLVRTADSKSQKEHSGYEAAIISNPGMVADGDDTSPNDHLDRKEANKSKEGALSTEDADDYEHLVKN